MANDSAGPGKGPIPRVVGVDDFQRHLVAELLGESFGKVPVPDLPAENPDLDRAVAELRRLREAIAGIGHSEVEVADVADRLIR